MKTIVVMPVKNEAWILPRALELLSLFADHIIIADQRSTDGSREIMKNFPKVLIIDNPVQYHSSDVRGRLLNAARDFEGYNAIFSFDADELPTVDILQPKFQDFLKETNPGTALKLEWIQLWRSPKEYRYDNSVWTGNWKHFGFIDDRKATYENLGVINDHTYRLPAALIANTVTLQQPKVLHYQFVDFERMLAKQRLYRITELIQHPGNNLKNSLAINQRYAASKDELGLKLRPVPETWTDNYKNIYNLASAKQNKQPSWQQEEALRLLKAHGARKFKWLDIWDHQWPELEDPRSGLIKFYHKHYSLLSHLLWLAKTILKKLFGLAK